MNIFPFKKEPSCSSSKWKTEFTMCFISFHCSRACWVGRGITNDPDHFRAGWAEQFDTSHALLHPLITDPDGLITVKNLIIWIMTPMIWSKSWNFLVSLSHYPLETVWHLTCPPTPTWDWSRLNDRYIQVTILYDPEQIPMERSKVSDFLVSLSHYTLETVWHLTCPPTPT